MKKLRIAQLILPWISLPPRKYGGTERVVYLLTEELVKRGHSVTLYSVGSTSTSARLKSLFDTEFHLQTDVIKTLQASFYPLAHVASSFRDYKEYDIIHSHAQFLGLPFGAVSPTPTVHTFHRSFSVESEEEKFLLDQYKSERFTSLSNSHRIPGLNFVGTAYNGVDTSVFKPHTQPSRDFLFWSGRVIDKKGPLEAIKAARLTRTPLVMAGKVTDSDYFEKYVVPHLKDGEVRFVGELTQDELQEYYQHALATLFPIKWEEPFGLIMTESMASGTPVIAFNQGAVPEVILDQKTGFIINNEGKNDKWSIKETGVNGLVEAINTLKTMKDEDYQHVALQSRKHVETKFSVSSMVDAYEQIYAHVLKK